MNEDVERAYRTREAPPLKAVAVRVTARIERVWFQVPGVSSSRPGYVLRLLDADTGTLVDIPEEIRRPPENDMALRPEPSREEKTP